MQAKISKQEATPTKKVNGESLNEVLYRYKNVKLPIKITSVGDKLIAPTYRRQMKIELLNGLINDMVKSLDGDAAELVLNSDGLMLVAQNEEEGFYTIELDFKIKNIDYDPF